MDQSAAQAHLIPFGVLPCRPDGVVVPVVIVTVLGSCVVTRLVAGVLFVVWGCTVVPGVVCSVFSAVFCCMHELSAIKALTTRTSVRIVFWILKVSVQLYYISFRLCYISTMQNLNKFHK